MATKLFSVEGVGPKVELGKDGHVIDGQNAAYVKVTDKDDTLLPVKGGDATASDEFVTQSQLDAVEAKTGGYLSYSYDASSGISQLSGQGSGDAGAIQYMDTFKVTTGGSFLGSTAEAGDFVIALTAGADVSDNTGSNTDWLLDTRRTAGDLADDTTLEASGGQIQIKDGGVSSAKLAADAVNSGSLVADDVIDSEHIAAGALDNEHYADVSITNGKIANSTIEKAKLVAAVQTTLTNADTQYGTRNGNFESAIGGSFDSDSDAAIAAQTNYATNTTITGQLSQLDSRMKLDNDDNALRVVSASHSGGAQNIGSAVKSGRTLTAVKILPVTVANGADATMSIGISGDASKYVSVADIDLYESTVQVIQLAHTLGSDEQLIATVTQGTATQGTFTVVVEHG
ncbi:hypothetical protein NVP1123O_56 [Vibrio phage 1.123.O._10N.286.48.F3]|nr:hypothetical protein NVP1123O_56 [Vibrio phage 1.123.O._10N.286.48.F3]